MDSVDSMHPWIKNFTSYGGQPIQKEENTEQLLHGLSSVIFCTLALCNTFSCMTNLQGLVWGWLGDSLPMEGDIYGHNWSHASEE